MGAFLCVHMCVCVCVCGCTLSHISLETEAVALGDPLRLNWCLLCQRLGPGGCDWLVYRWTFIGGRSLVCVGARASVCTRALAVCACLCVRLCCMSLSVHLCRLCVFMLYACL